MSWSVYQVLVKETDRVSAFNGLSILVTEPGKQANRMKVRQADVERW